MKKLLFIITIFFLSVTSSFAVFFIEGQGDYISTGDFDPVIGLGAGLGFSLNDDVNFRLRCSTAQNTENEGEIEEIKYDYSTVTAGIEYIPPIAILEQYRLYWKNSLNLGASMFEIEMTKMNGDKTDEKGFIASYWTGLQFNFTQTIAPYFDLGYHRSFYSKTSSDYSIKGWQLALGVRFYIGGSRDYNAGY